MKQKKDTSKDNKKVFILSIATLLFVLIFSTHPPQIAKSQQIVKDSVIKKTINRTDKYTQIQYKLKTLKYLEDRTSLVFKEIVNNRDTIRSIVSNDKPKRRKKVVSKDDNIIYKSIPILVKTKDLESFKNSFNEDTIETNVILIPNSKKKITLLDKILNLFKSKSKKTK